ncbi:helix-turn-helix domain-containing protein [Streptomyces sp. NPDC052127]|uniref:helix-turn-helix domain-containing protein n=1 Tax=Streptomyces sp. NPDC052127 TaxID=3155679 RepID=UPI0034246BA6
MTPAWVVKRAFKDVWLYDWLRARYGGLNGIWPGIDTLATEFGVSRSTIERTIRRLVAAGCMEIRPRFREDGSQTTNQYVTKFDEPTN